jgi:FKBP-type peptidyl-prolyl cis-trans isomerase
MTMSSLFARLQAATGRQSGVEAIGIEEQRSDDAQEQYKNLAAVNNAAGNATNKSDMKATSSESSDANMEVLIKTLKPGDITHYPKKGDICTIHYEVFKEDEIIDNGGNATPFDSSRGRNQVFKFRLGDGQVIDGMDIAVSKMSVGQLIEATIPYMYAYGIGGFPPVVPPRATLVFRIELISCSSF